MAMVHYTHTLTYARQCCTWFRIVFTKITPIQHITSYQLLYPYHAKCCILPTFQSLCISCSSSGQSNPSSSSLTYNSTNQTQAERPFWYARATPEPSWHLMSYALHTFYLGESATSMESALRWLGPFPHITFFPCTEHGTGWRGGGLEDNITNLSMILGVGLQEIWGVIVFSFLVW